VIENDMKGRAGAKAPTHDPDIWRDSFADGELKLRIGKGRPHSARAALMRRIDIDG
jgi:hypothetical protein